VISVRDAVPDDALPIAQVHVDTWRTAYAGILADAYLASLSVDERAEKWRKRLDAPPAGYFCFVALEGERVIGFVDGGPVRGGHAPHRGEIYAFYVLPEEHRRGVGRALVGAAFTRLRSDDRLPILIWVLGANPAVGFYERIGGRRVGEKTSTIGGTTNQEIGFGYDEAACLAIVQG